MFGLNFAELWAALEAELALSNQRLAAQAEAAHADLVAAIRTGADAFRAAGIPPVAHGQLASLDQLLEDGGRRLLFEAIQPVLAARPQARFLAALEAHTSAREDLVQRLPQTIAVSGRARAKTLGAGGMRHLWMDRQSGPAEFPLRAAVRDHLLWESGVRAPLEGACLQLLAEASLDLLYPWQEIRRLALRRLAGQDADAEAFERNRERWLEGAQALEARCAEALAARNAWDAGCAGRLASALLASGRSVPERRPDKREHHWQRCFGYWSRQQRAVTATLELELDLARVASETVRSGMDALAELDREHAALLAELDEVIAWLGNPEEGDFPAPRARLEAAENRTAEWLHTAGSAGRQLLPLRVETMEPRSALPPRRPPWRGIEPQAAFQAALARSGRSAALAGFREAEAAGHAIVREIERAREVVEFSLETARADSESGPQIAREGFANARALTEYQRQITVDPRPAAERKLAEGISGTLFLMHFSLEQGRLGLLAHLLRQSGSEAVRQARAFGFEKTSAGGRWATTVGSAFYHGSLRRIGWEVPPVPADAPVLSRGYLSDVLSLPWAARDLPLIYRRLFRLAPVEEPRFLVGRAAEMAALAQVRRCWQANRAVSVVIVGARGSGKTSLLNCAVAAEFADVPVIRSQFKGRITTAEGMRAFLRELFGLAKDGDVAAALASRNAVVILEEFERTFLRRMGGFEGLRELLSVISATSRGVLWIVSLNQHSYHYLNAAAGLEEHFSHRINAMAVAPEQLKSAILLRHNLSGLRLEYPPALETGTRLPRLRRVLGLERSAEESFFDSLYVQSEGVFRSAFQLWQQFMERAEGGVLYLQRPVQPDYNPLIAQITQEDAFTLQAILQHGSLTAEEHAEVFACSAERSRVRLERLLAIECLEPEPLCPGLRIRPEAGRMVRIALHRLNLI